MTRITPPKIAAQEMRRWICVPPLTAAIVSPVVATGIPGSYVLVDKASSYN
jgi:hypothetical protein